MNSTLRYKILEDCGLILEKFVGTINLSDMIVCVSKLFSDKKYDPNYLVLCDIRNANFVFNNNDLSKFIEFSHNAYHKFEVKENRFMALLAHTPKQTALANLYSEKGFGIFGIFKVFSTEEAALDWLTLRNNTTIDTKVIISELNVL